MAKSKQQTDGLRREVFGLPLYIIILLVFLLLFPLMLSVAGGAPVITQYNNSVSNDTIYPHVNTSQNVQFNVVANETVTWNWYLDEIPLSNNYNNYTKSWTDGGAHRIAVNGTNANGSTGTVTWYVMVFRPKSGVSDIHTALNTSWFTSLTDSLKGSADFSKFFLAIVLPFTTSLGDLFYVFVFGLPMIVIWLRQEKALIPAILGIIFGALIFGFIPKTWILPAILMMILTVFGIIYALFKER